MTHWLKHLQRYLGKKSKTPAPTFLHSMGGNWGIPISPAGRFDQMVKEGYCHNVIVYRCVSLIARNLSSVSWALQQGSHIMTAHPLLTLIQSPNALQTCVTFLEGLSSHLLLFGNAYVEMTVQDKECIQLYLLRPDRVQIVPEAHDLHYIYSVDGHQRVIKRDHPGAIHPVLHIKTFHPLNDWYGLSPLEAAASSIHHHNQVGQHNLAILRHGGRPSGAVIFDNEDNPRLSQEEYQRIREEIRRVFEGVENAGRVAFLEGNMRWQEMAVSPKDMDFVNGKYLSAREISQAYGVPPLLVGVPGDATFANYKEARLHLWEDTILPLLDKIITAMNGWLCPLYGHDLKFTYDVNDIPALVARRDSLWSRMEECSFLTEDEKREALGYGPRPR